MLAVIDCGTTNTRIYILNSQREIIAEGSKKVGVRDTSITGTKDRLKQGIEELFHEILLSNQISPAEIRWAMASGMITSEIGLLEIPHLIAPAGREELAANIVRTASGEVLALGCPVYFVPGIRNRYADGARIFDLRQVDFMRGEEVQLIGISSALEPGESCFAVTLSSHTKVSYLDGSGKVVSSITSLSGQMFEALVNSTNIGKSIMPVSSEGAGGYAYEELVDTALDCVEQAGLMRTLLMPRFMEVLLKTSSEERNIFTNAAIAADDLKIFCEIRKNGYWSSRFILYGQQRRCEMYRCLLRKKFGDDLDIRTICGSRDISRLTIQGMLAVAGQCPELPYSQLS